MLTALFPWLALMFAGLVAGILLLVWASKSGQFAEQDRARFLPLRDAGVSRPGNQTPRSMPELYVFLVLMAALACSVIAALVLLVTRQTAG